MRISEPDEVTYFKYDRTISVLRILSDSYEDELCEVDVSQNYRISHFLMKNIGDIFLTNETNLAPCLPPLLGLMNTNVGMTELGTEIWNEPA